LQLCDSLFSQVRLTDYAFGCCDVAIVSDSSCRMPGSFLLPRKGSCAVRLDHLPRQESSLDALQGQRIERLHRARHFILHFH
jgi:hypothetical protein